MWPELHPLRVRRFQHVSHHALGSRIGESGPASSLKPVAATHRTKSSGSEAALPSLGIFPYSSTMQTGS